MKESILKGVFVAALAGAVAYFRELILPVVVLAAVMSVDYISGMVSAWIMGELSSRVGVMGIIKKAAYLLAVAVAIVADWIVQTAAGKIGVDFGGFYFFGLLVTIWLILNECISILENVSEIGVPLPAFLLRIVQKLKKTVETAGEEAADESSTIGSAGCGPTCAAMLVETLTGKTFTPEDACKWSMERGYKALNQGTYYSYFKPQFAVFGIDCDMLNWTPTYGKPNHTNHDKALELLKQGCYLIALMNKGNWTSSGHFIVVWWADGKIRINDPASTKDSRVNGDLYTFRSEAKYY